MIDMRIGKYHITSEPRNYIVAIAKLEDDGTPSTTSTKNGLVLTERVMGYYNSLEMAFKAIAKVMMAGGDDRVTTVEQYAKKAKLVDAILNHSALKYGQDLKNQLPGEGDKNDN